MDDAVPPLGLLYNAAQGRNLFEQPRNYAVGGDHEVFNQLSGVVFLLLHHVDHLVVQHQGMEFVGLQVEGSVFIAAPLQLLRGFVLQAQLGLQIGGGCDLRRRRCRALQPRSHRVVLELRPVANQSAINVAGGYVAVGVHHKFDDHAQAVLIFQQGSLARGKLFGEHGEVSDSCIHRRRFSGGMLINRALLGDEGIQVGNADQNFCFAIR